MNNNHELTKKAVLDAVRERAQQTRPTLVKVNNGPKLLGQFLQKCLKRREISRVAFAQSLDMETELADAILDRLTANVHRIELKGESLRRKKTKEYQ